MVLLLSEPVLDFRIPKIDYAPQFLLTVLTSHAYFQLSLHEIMCRNVKTTETLLVRNVEVTWKNETVIPKRWWAVTWKETMKRNLSMQKILEVQVSPA